MGTRETIVEAAERVMREKGLARSTTKEIARAAGFSEGTLYKYFDSKEELFLAVLTERLPSLVATMDDLPARVGHGSVRATLEEVTGMALAFFSESVPITASIMSEPALLATHAEAVRGKGAGPDTPNQALAGYLRAEQRLGRVRGDVNPETAAAMLFGACLQRTFFRLFFAAAADPARERRFAADIVHVLMEGLSPDARS